MMSVYQEKRLLRESGGSVEPPSTPTYLGSSDGDIGSAGASRQPSHQGHRGHQGRRGSHRSAYHSIESRIMVVKDLEGLAGHSSSSMGRGASNEDLRRGDRSSSSSSAKARSQKTVGYMKHAALVLLSLMVCVALAVFIAYHMTFGRDEAVPTARVDTGSGDYPPLVVPRPRYVTEKPSKFAVWVLGLLTKVPAVSLTREDTEATTTFVEEGTMASTEEVVRMTTNITFEVVSNATQTD